MSEPQKSVATIGAGGPSATPEHDIPRTPPKADPDAASGTDRRDGDETLSAEEIREKQKDLVQISILRSQEMLVFASERNLSLSKEVIATLTTTFRIFGTSDWNDEAEAAFWEAYREISRVLSPVSHSSIEWSKKRSRGVSLLMTSLGLSVLLLLVVAQIYYVYVKNTSTQINTSITAFDEIGREIDKVQMQTQVLENSHYTDLLTQGYMRSPDTGYVVNSITGELANPPDDPKYSELTANWNNLFTQHQRLEAGLQAQYAILEFWVPELVQDANRKQAAAISDSEPGDPPMEFLQSSSADNNTDNFLEEEKRARALQVSKRYLLAQAESILLLMSTYFLPLLYGLLGTCAYVLRSVSRGMRDMVLTNASMLNYMVRIPLGMLSGVAVGWFLNDSTLPDGWKELQPLALAFAAGYSVELIFTAMDRLVGASSQPKTADP